MASALTESENELPGDEIKLEELDWQRAEVREPDQEHGLIREAAILLMATDRVLWDDMDVEDAIIFSRRLFEGMDTHPLWSGGKHSGDCTRQAHPCIRCQGEKYERIAKILRSSSDDLPNFFDTCMEAMTTPFDNPTLIAAELPEGYEGPLKPTN